MAIASIANIVTALAKSHRVSVYRSSTANSNAVAMPAVQSQWLNGDGGAAPPLYSAGSGYACDKSTPGAAPYRNAATQNYLARIQGKAISGTTGQAIVTLDIFDRFWACRGIGSTTGTYTVTTPGALPARVTDDGLTAELWIESVVDANALGGGVTLAANYLDSAGNVQTTPTVALPSVTYTASSMTPMPLANSLGVKQLTSAVIGGSNFSSGSVGMVILRRIASVRMNGQMRAFGWAELGLPRLPNDACLYYGTFNDPATIGRALFSMDIIDA